MESQSPKDEKSAPFTRIDLYAIIGAVVIWGAYYLWFETTPRAVQPPNYGRSATVRGNVSANPYPERSVTDRIPTDSKSNAFSVRRNAIENDAPPPEPLPFEISPPSPVQSDAKRNSDFPVAQPTWAERFVKPSDEIPTNAFKAFYFGGTVPNENPKTDVVEHPSVNYAWSDFHGIRSEDFAAYWIGDFVFEENEIRDVTVSQSWAETRVVIDGREIYRGGSDASIPYQFEAWKHRIEVEFVNNWHTVGFDVKFSPRMERIDTNRVRAILSQYPGAEIWYAGVYESSNLDASIPILLKKIGKPVILILSSYESVTWDVSEHDSNLKAVVVSSFKPRATVRWTSANVPVFWYEWLPYAYETVPNCVIEMGYCEGDSFGKMTSVVRQSFGIDLTGFSGQYGAKSLTVPELVLSAEKYAEIEARKRDTQSKMDAHNRRGTSVDNVFDN